MRPANLVLISTLLVFGGCDWLSTSLPPLPTYSGGDSVTLPEAPPPDPDPPPIEPDPDPDPEPLPPDPDPVPQPPVPQPPVALVQPIRVTWDRATYTNGNAIPAGVISSYKLRVRNVANNTWAVSAFNVVTTWADIPVLAAGSYDITVMTQLTDGTNSQYSAPLNVVLQ